MRKAERRRSDALSLHLLINPARFCRIHRVEFDKEGLYRIPRQCLAGHLYSHHDQHSHDEFKLVYPLAVTIEGRDEFDVELLSQQIGALHFCLSNGFELVNVAEKGGEPCDGE